jgi:2,4-dienoyl-CoA reductase-like NADH-dependent reductase (Old Yellow Enzyme family)/thioredoxin reductase
MKLSDPIQIKNCRFSNRAVMAPMVPNTATLDGAVTEEYENFYLARARSQIGYIVLGAAYVHLDGKGFQRQLGIYDDRHIPGLKKLVASLAQHTRLGIQLSFKSLGRMPEDFSRSEIVEYRNAFITAAIRAQTCGFDAIELHACHDYWLNFFLSPHFNHRQDTYGGDLEHRFRLLKETVTEVRSAIDGDMLLGVRLSIDEFVEDGLTLTDSTQVGRWLEDIGVDYISASGGIGITQYRMSPPMEVDRGSLLPLARALKKEISIPVIGVGRLDRPQTFRQAISEEYADMAAVARSLIADPEYVAKIIAAKDEEIRPCVACNFCLVCLHRGDALRCAVNPYVGDDLIQLQPVKSERNVVVVGGGPAGLSCAANAAARGARVKLYEKNANLGGTVSLGMRPPFKEVLQDLVDYLTRKAQKEGVDIVTGTEATADILRGENADRIVIATGATAIRPSVEGAKSGDPIFCAEDILGWQDIAPGRYLVIGGGAVGLETAEILAESKVTVTVIEMTEVIGSGLHATRLHLLLERLRRSGVTILSLTKLIAIEDQWARVKSEAGLTQLGPFDSFVFAVGSKSNRDLVEAMEQKMPVEVIGDAVRPRTIYEAVREGFESALQLK